MKKSILIGLMGIIFFTACKQANSKKDNKGTASAKTAAQLAEASTVNIYYFHGPQRCKTCIAVEKVARETIEKTYANNKNVCFVMINIEDEANAELIEKYQIAWNALIIEKGDNYIDLTKNGFANAVNTPDVFIEAIKKEVNARL